MVEPRGGTLWIGTLIETCALHGLSEGLVRTAVHRLVAAGRLAGERVGRRSYYRLTPAARAEFAAAARALFDPAPPATAFLLRPGGPPLAPADLARGWVEGGGIAAAPAQGPVPPLPGPLFRAEPVAGDLAGWAAGLWPLGRLAAEYDAFLVRYRPLLALAGGGAGIAPDAALPLRLRVVHDFRRALLADPRLPAAALPPDWPSDAGRSLFDRLYLALAPADAAVAAAFRDAGGPLPAETPATRARIAAIRRRTGPA